MSEYVDFHYMPLEGKITGKQVLKQTEDAINDLGNKVYNLDIDEGRIDEAIEKSDEAINTADAALAAVTTDRAVWKNTVAEMQATNIDLGVTAATRGKMVFNDGNGAFYGVRSKKSGDVESDDTVFLDNGNVAERIKSMNFIAKGNNIIFVTNVAELISSDAVVGNVYGTTGYYSANDGGACVYTIRTKTQSDVDNGGSIIFLDNGKVAELITDGTVNVKQFGVVGDGVTDDSVKLNALFLNLSQDMRGKAIYFPPGKYALADTVNIDDKYCLNVICEGEFRNIATVGKPSFNLTNLLECNFTGMTFFSGVNNCIVIGDNCVQVKFTHTVFNNIAAYAVSYDYNTITQRSLVQFEDVVLNYTCCFVYDVCPNTDHGAEIIIRNVKFTQVSHTDLAKDMTKFPAFIYLKNIHDFRISGLMGGAEGSTVRIERDSNGQIDNTNTTSWQKPTLMLVDEGTTGPKVIATNVHIWNIDSTTGAVGISAGKRSTLTLSEFDVNYCSVGLMYEGQNSLFLTNGIFRNNTYDMELTNMNVSYVGIATNVFLSNVEFKSPTALYTDVPQGYMQQMYFRFMSCIFNAQLVRRKYNDTPVSMELIGCRLYDNTGLANTIAYFCDNDRRNSAPTVGIYKRGYVVINSEPSAGGNYGWVCTTGGQIHNKTWSANTAYVAGDIILNASPYTYCICMKGGTSGSTTPTFAINTEVEDGTVVWLGTNGYTAVFKAFGTIAP